MSKELLFQKTDEPSFRIARRVASRARRGLEFVEKLPDLARDGTVIDVNVSRTGIDILDIGEGRQMCQAGLSAVAALKMFRKIQHKGYLDEFMQFGLGSVGTYELSDGTSMIGAPITYGRDKLEDDRGYVEDVFDRFASSVGIQLVDGIDPHLALATFSGEVDGVQDAVEFAGDHLSGSIDMFETLVFNAQRVHKENPMALD